MKTITYIVISFIIGCVCCILSLNIYWADPDNWDLRQNGLDWPQMGPALISSCNCNRIVIMIGQFNVAIEDGNKIIKIKKWIEDNNIVNRMNFAPMWPHFRWGRSIIAADGIYLFSSTGQPDDNSRIMSIPLTTSTLGVSEIDLTTKLAELKALTKNE